MAGVAKLLVMLLIAVFIVSQTEGWKGNYGTRTICKYKSVRVCVYRTWRACCGWKWIRKAYTVKKYFCLQGWTHNGDENCNKAICNPPCKNGGTCSTPNNCDCTAAYNGPTCEGRLCSHQKPCYPGVCSFIGGGGSQCDCERNFQFESNGCLEMREELSPEIYQCQIVLRNYMPDKRMDEYAILLDTTVNNNTIMGDTLWSNRREYNRIDLMGVSNFNPEIKSPIPTAYISEAKFGLVNVTFQINHVRYGNTTVPNPEAKLQCQDQPSKDNPLSGVHNCTVLDQTYHKSIINGDTMTIILHIESGGYRKLKDIDTGKPNGTQYYTGQKQNKSMMFSFDSVKPTHCFPTCNKSEQILDLGQEYKKDAKLNITWSGWEDKLSGVYRYAWEVFPLTANGDGELREKTPLEPIIIREVNHTNSIQYPTFTLPKAGLYSVVLQVADKANNSEYVRRFVLYDPEAKIDISDDPQYVLRASSSSKESNYTWQADISGVTSFDWTNFFFNQFLDENQLLNKILRYPTQFEDEDFLEHKRLSIKYNSKDGRTEAKVPNARGMTLFQYGFHKDSNGGKTQPNEPNTWLNLTNPVQTKFDLTQQVSDGETLVFWVKATDPFGNERIGKTQTNFDSTPPTVTSVSYDYESVPDGKSRLTCIAKDMDSGILLVSWKAIRGDTNTEYANGTLPWPVSNYQANADIREFVCLSKINRCFQIEAQLDINSCDLTLPSSDISTSVTLNVDIRNQAMISGATTYTFKIDDVTKLSGYKKCYPDYESGLSGGAIAGIIIGVLLLVVIIILVFLFVTNRPPFTKSRKERGSVYIQNALGKSKQTNVPSTSAYPNNAYKYDDNDDVYLYGAKDFEKGQSWQIPHYQLTLLGDITTGRFARIFKAKLKSREEEVVAKMMKNDFTPDDEMLMKAKINYMATVVGTHPNVLEFVGAVIDNTALGPVMVLEYCEEGQLDKWLISQKGIFNSDTTEKLQRIAFGACKGMAYLASKKIVHKKLAARNVLLTFTGEPKITGFGPSKSTEDEDARERIPIKWTAPECMSSLKEANQRSDVWSFGIVLWEIFSLGETPYSGMRSRDVESKVKGGYRMSKPEMSDDFYYSIMSNCWLENPRKRESFKKITEKISGTFTDKSSDDNYYYR